MAEKAGVRYRPFKDIHEDKTKEMQRLVYEYVKGMKEMVNHVSGGTDPTAPTDKTIKLNEAEFPILPDIKVLDQCDKTEAASIMDEYIKHHYRELCRQ